MNKQVTDISAVLKKLTSDVSSMRKTIDEQHTIICNLTRSNERLTKENRELRKRLSKYEEPTKDSDNSSTPPSKERMKDEVLRRTKSLRKRSDRKPGGQKGHEGQTLVKTATPDVTEDISPVYCKNCGSSLEDCERILDYITQVVSLPDLNPIVKEFRHYITICKRCGKPIQSHAPRKRGTNAVIYDATVKSMVVYMSVVLFLSYGRIADFFEEVYGLRISQGSMVNWIGQAKKSSAPAIERIKEYIMKSSVVGFDESGCYCNKRLDWAWIAQTVYFTLVFRGNGRSSKELESRFGESLKRMIAVTDRHSAYFALHFLNHQVCLAHLLRELQYLNELDKGQTWSKEVEKLLQEAIHQRNERPHAVIDKMPWLERLDNLLKKNIEGAKKQFSRMKNGLIKCRDYIFNFLEDPLIPSDNNASERGIRKLKVKLKNSGTFRSDLGADAFFDIHSIVETAKKQHQTPFKAIRALFQGTDSIIMGIAE